MVVAFLVFSSSSMALHHGQRRKILSPPPGADLVKAQALFLDPNSLAPRLFLHPIRQCKVGVRQGSGRCPGPHGNAYTA